MYMCVYEHMPWCTHRIHLSLVPSTGAIGAHHCIWLLRGCSRLEPGLYACKAEGPCPMNISPAPVEATSALQQHAHRSL